MTPELAPDWTPLSVLCRAPAERVKAWAEELLEGLEDGDVDVQHNATGLVLLPMADSVQGGPFLLGEVLVAEARVRLRSAQGYSVWGYAAVLGRDLQQALAAALLDAASRLPEYAAQVQGWTDEERAAQWAADETLLREVEATRVEMETF